MDKFWDRFIYTITQIIWYILPGEMILFIFLFPFLLLVPEKTFSIITEISGIMWIGIGIILGFIMEGLRLYRFRPRYKKIRKEFFAKLQVPFQNKKEDINPYYILDIIYDLATEKHYDTIRLYHSIWIMLGQLSISFLLAGVAYFPAVVFAYFKITAKYYLVGQTVSANLYVVTWSMLCVLAIILGIRIMYVSLEEQRKVNDMYIDFMNSNKTELLKRIKDGDK